jgi:hypothetical protein
MKTAILPHAKQRPQRGPSLTPGKEFVTCAQAAEILRAADQMLTPADRVQIAAGIEQARRRMNNEHLH